MEYKFRDVKRALINLGLQENRLSGHCMLFIRKGYANTVSIPCNHKGKDVHKSLIQRELRKVELTIQDFEKVV